MVISQSVNLLVYIVDARGATTDRPDALAARGSTLVEGGGGGGEGEGRDAAGVGGRAGPAIGAKHCSLHARAARFSRPLPRAASTAASLQSTANQTNRHSLQLVGDDAPRKAPSAILARVAYRGALHPHQWKPTRADLERSASRRRPRSEFGLVVRDADRSGALMNSPSSGRLEDDPGGRQGRPTDRRVLESATTSGEVGMHEGAGSGTLASIGFGRGYADAIAIGWKRRRRRRRRRRRPMGPVGVDEPPPPSHQCSAPCCSALPRNQNKYI
uniref:Uncharacterized protein n=1 Tax=Plectus sambesii TaxID=2011161 RepID=A0A914UUH4_9BILA